MYCAKFGGVRGESEGVRMRSDELYGANDEARENVKL
jgi:hypothetical protein